MKTSHEIVNRFLRIVGSRWEKKRQRATRGKNIGWPVDRLHAKLILLF